MTGQHIRRRRDPFRQARSCACGDHGFVGLTRGMVAILDVGDLPLVAPYLWNAKLIKGGTFYAETTMGRYCIGMHRVISGQSRGDGKHVDHRDGDTLNNRSANLRPCGAGENVRNGRKRRNNKRANFKGVFPHGGKWGFEVSCSGVRQRGYNYQTQEDAARAYDEAAMRLHGEFARTNAMLGLFDSEAA